MSNGVNIKDWLICYLTVMTEEGSQERLTGYDEKVEIEIQPQAHLFLYPHSTI